MLWITFSDLPGPGGGRAGARLGLPDGASPERLAREPRMRRPLLVRDGGERLAVACDHLARTLLVATVEERARSATASARRPVRS